MKITDFLDPSLVLDDLQAATKTEALREMADRLAMASPSLDRDRIFQVLLEREKVSSTAIGEGVAIPHGKLPGLEGIRALFVRSRKGIDFESLDGAPTHLLFVLLAPENSAGDHLKALARISRLLKDPEFRNRLLRASSSREIYEAIKEEDERLP